MSSFLKRGLRIKVREQKKEVKKRTKDFYAILHELDDIAEILKKDDTVTADNLEEKASQLTSRKIESLEKFVLMGKLGMYVEMEKQIPGYKELTKEIEDAKDNT